VFIWNGPRKSASWTIGVAVLVVVGSFVDRVRVYAAAWTVAMQVPEEHLPDTLPPLPLPGVLEVAACLGMLAAAALLATLLFRPFTTLSEWELRAAERLTPERRMLRARVTVVGRPS
jgi:hypothetical protein